MRTLFLILTAFLITPNALAQRDREVKWVNADIPSVKGLEHKVLASKSLGHDVGYVVWTPPGFNEAEVTRYPVVYFLHGAGGSEASDSGGFASRLADAIGRNKFPPAICVFPNGGMSGYRGNVERMVVDELIPSIDADYPTNCTPSARAIVGFSMGGSGAVALAIQHPDLFCAAGSWGGALSRQGNGEDSPLLPAAMENADSLKQNAFALLTVNGDGDRPDGFTPLAKILQLLGISHQTVTLEDTNHNFGKYYESSGDTMIAFLAQRLTVKSHHADQSARIIRVLSIGNSFAGNACKYLKQIASDGGIELVIGTANLGGCTLERHATLAKQFASDSKSRPYSYSSESDETRLSLQEYLVAQPWDFVTLQQMSALSHQSETYHPYIDELVALIGKHASNAEIVMHQTWAYRADSPLLKGWDITQDQMHEGLSEAYAEVAEQFGAKIMPVGLAFQIARSADGREVVVPDPSFDYLNPVYPNLPDQQHSLVVGWHWRSQNDKRSLWLDFKHANASGCYLAGLVWYETLTGNDARDIRYVPDGVNQSDALFLRGVAHDAVASTRAVNKRAVSK
ncbi:DUF4886 domain-containing protein [Rubripirellula reticaptiva]|uniref:Endo-1,4-beta-xylanase/feruloyl esterase n=1 Tax=Rubripirellula reticaptiva TaxID=2528013 RepID=A0A5C6EL66_9BACT|nr:DUF4886 domain-containing protein [Rubripirellula reticaptiva]TWU49578.1 Endo-1,4-beta-xylanase/feruloyl esterase precursor [Rubripirellula reticaptiva]